MNLPDLLIAEADEYLATYGDHAGRPIVAVATDPDLAEWTHGSGISNLFDLMLAMDTQAPRPRYAALTLSEAFRYTTPDANEAAAVAGTLQERWASGDPNVTRVFHGLLVTPGQSVSLWGEPDGPDPFTPTVTRWNVDTDPDAVSGDVSTALYALLLPL